MATGVLALTACSHDDEDNGFEPADPANASQAAADAETDSKPHTLSDTVTVGNTLTISDAEIDTTGCEFTFPEDIKRDAVKFDVLATVDNQTGEDISEALWGSDFTFLDADGLTVKTTDIASAEGPCSNDNAHQFVDLKDGEKRRAAVTLEAPAGATTMTYSASTIAGAEPVTWDIADAIAGMTVTSPAEKDQGDGPAPTPAADTPEPAGAPENEVTATCATDPIYQPGTTFYSNGTSGYTAACQQQMEDAMEASGNYPDYPFGNVDPNWTEQDAMRGQPLVEDLDDIAPDRHNGPGEFEPAG
ncbi:MAG: hypothetical protein ACI38U_09265 [Corynebacterium sp.]|uniref:hypothetical protein n=1 Tax=Corynebacterium sp. TaxID=1720 RepID=UPI003F020447